MKKLFVLLCVSVYVFSFELTFNKKFVKDAIPDLLSSNISVIVFKTDETDISPILAKYTKYFDNDKSVDKKNGLVSILPKYKYTNGISQIIGYTGRIQYKISSQKAENINSFIQAILELRDDEAVSISITALKWQMSDDKYNQILDSLRLEAVQWPIQYSQTLSSKLAKTCEVKNININRSVPRNMYRSSVSSKQLSVSSSDVILPKQTKNTLSLTPSYLLDCK